MRTGSRWRSATWMMQSIPTLLFFKNGEVVDKRVGVVSKDEIVSIINSIA